MTSSDRRWMQAAFAIARRGSGKTSTNPAVGCVIVKDGRLLGRGQTGEGGRPHAETEALQMALARFGARAVTGATAYVTLEPCAHHGRTPPCADALVAAGIARVVAPLADPDPRVSGAGFAKLRAGGVEVVTGVAAPEGEAQLAGYLRRVRTGRPHVTLKLAATLDGRIAMASGESRWITGPVARRRVHLMRAAVDGVLVGGGTALADDPMLDVRLPGLERRNPVRIVADRRLRMPGSARMLADAARAPVWVIGDGEGFPERASALTAAGARLVQCAADGDIAMQLATLGRLGLGTVLCEGGGGLAAALLKAGCVDRLHMISAGRMIGAEGTGCLGPLGIENLAETPCFARIGIEALGADIMTMWEPATGTA